MGNCEQISGKKDIVDKKVNVEGYPEMACNIYWRGGYLTVQGDNIGITPTLEILFILGEKLPIKTNQWKFNKKETNCITFVTK